MWILCVMGAHFVCTFYHFVWYKYVWWGCFVKQLNLIILAIWCCVSHKSSPIHANCVEEFLDMAKKKKTKALGVCTMHLVSNHLRIVELFYLSIFKISFNFQGKIKSIVWVRDFSWHGIGTWHVMWWFFLLSLLQINEEFYNKVLRLKK